MHADKLKMVLLFHAIKQVKSETDIKTEMKNIGGLIGLLIRDSKPIIFHSIVLIL